MVILELNTTNQRFYEDWITAIGPVFGLTARTDVLTLAFLAARSNHITGQVSLTPKARKELIAYSKLANPQTVVHSLNRLKTLGILTGDDGEYVIEPRAFRQPPSPQEAVIKLNIITLPLPE